jgi:hypothetical protein
MLQADAPKKFRKLLTGFSLKDSSALSRIMAKARIEIDFTLDEKGAKWQ